MKKLILVLSMTVAGVSFANDCSNATGLAAQVDCYKEVARSQTKIIVEANFSEGSGSKLIGNAEVVKHYTDAMDSVSIEVNDLESEAKTAYENASLTARKRCSVIRADSLRTNYSVSALDFMSATALIGSSSDRLVLIYKCVNENDGSSQNGNF